MKLISWNVRGLGSFEKRREVCQLVREKKPFIPCLQETKLYVIDALICKFIWGEFVLFNIYAPCDVTRQQVL